MLKLIILKFWPALIPILLYLIWLWYKRRDARIVGISVPGFFDGPWRWPVTLSLLLIIAGFVWLGLSNENNADKTNYSPTKLRDGILIKDRLE